MSATKGRDLKPACINNGGLKSLISLDNIPVLNKETTLTSTSVAKLVLWQARPGEIVTLRDPRGGFYRARISALTGNEGKVVVFQPLFSVPESPLRLDVYQALPEKERFELVLQKLTEIGVFRIVPFMSERSTTLEARDTGQKKSHRWPDVLLRAAKQCRRGIIPELSPVLTWSEAVKEGSRAGTAFFLWERENKNHLRDYLSKQRDCRHVAIFAGPEGGFSVREAEQLEAAGLLSLSMGPRILRTETAVIVAAALVQAWCGDLG